MKIGYNARSMEAYNSLLKTGRSMQVSSARLSTGVKINKASQNAAGLAISNTLRTQAEGIEKAGQNSSNAISILQTVDGSLSEMHSIINRMRELTLQASNDTNTASDRNTLQIEMHSLSQELDSISDRCEYNRIKMLRGGETGFDLSLTIHTGPNKGYNMQVVLPEVSAESLGLDTMSINVALEFDPANPEADVPSTEAGRAMRDYALVAADEALNRVSTLRANIGAYINRLEHTVSYLDTSSETTRTSLSRIFDTDMALEMTNYSKLQVLSQAATSIMSQANQSPQNILQLLQ